MIDAFSFIGAKGTPAEPKSQFNTTPRTRLFCAPSVLNCTAHFRCVLQWWTQPACLLPSSLGYAWDLAGFHLFVQNSELIEPLPAASPNDPLSTFGGGFGGTSSFFSSFGNAAGLGDPFNNSQF